MIEAKEIKDAQEKFEALKRIQLRDLEELEVEATALLGWITEFKKLLNSDAGPEEVVKWSKENDIEKEFKHIELF